MDYNNLDYGLIGSIVTVIVFVSFIGICLWVFGNKSQKDFEEAANLIFDDEPANQAAIDNKRESSLNE